MAAGSQACRPSVQIYPIILTIVIFVTVISVLKSYNNNNNNNNNNTLRNKMASFYLLNFETVRLAFPEKAKTSLSLRRS